MGFFGDDDPFDSIIKEFFQETTGPRTSSSRDVVKSEREERMVDYIEEDDKAYFVFELYGYSKKDISINISKGSIEIVAKKKELNGVQSYLAGKLEKGIRIRKNLPNIKIKKYDWTFNNGILEIEAQIK
jgi:HSP20 family molecular chaperone IbpA